MTRIDYFFRRTVISDLKMSKIGQYPKDFFYGLNYISNKIPVFVSDIPESSRIVRFFHNIFNIILYPIFNTNVSLVQILLQLKNINKYDLLFTTIDSYGLGICILKKIGLLDNKLVFNTIGLCDVLVNNKSQLRLKTYKNLLKEVDIFISGASWNECKKMASILKYPLDKFKFIPFGIDIDYFKPSKKIIEDPVLIIGADRKRDWDLYKKLFNDFNNEQFIVITHPGMVGFNPPHNVKLIYNISIAKVRDYIARAKFCVILSKQNYHFAGQSTAFRIMSMQKPVIFTRSFGVEEYKFKNEIECFLVNPGDYVMLKKYFIKITQKAGLRKLVSINARRKVTAKLTVEKYSAELLKIFKYL